MAHQTLLVIEGMAGLSLGVLVVVTLAVTARRLLGVRVGLLRTMVAGGGGYVIASLVAQGIMHRAPGKSVLVPNLEFLPVLIGISVLVAMLFLAAAEALVPSGSHPRPVRALRRRVARIRRYSQISAIALRHGLRPHMGARGPTGADGHESRARQARSLRLALIEAGVTFVKLGQLLSTRRDLLPVELIEELGRLQAQAPPARWPAVQKLLREELGAPPESVFAEFDPQPLAAASIAQVHAARLPSGAAVVVKIQRPEIRPVVERDLDIVLSIARTLELRTAHGTNALDTIQGSGRRGLNALELARGFATAIREELDFRVEARNAAAILATSAGGWADGAVRVPMVHEELCSERVLVLERLDGIPLGDAGPAIDERGLDRTALAGTLLECVLSQITLAGVFHADPHPGNVMLLADNRLALLDFGSVGRLDTHLRAALSQLLLAVDRGDPTRLRDALLELAQHPEELDEQHLERALGQFMARHLTPGVAPSLQMFTDLFRLVSRYGPSIPPEIAAVFRALSTLEGTLTGLAPGFDLVAQSRAFAAKQFTQRLRPTSIRQTLDEELTALLPVLRRLPQRVDRITGSLEHGRLSLNLRLFADERDRRVVTTLLHQALLAFLGATTGLIGVLLLGTGGGPRISPNLTLFELFGYTLLVISFMLVLRVLFIIFRPERRAPR